MRRFFECLVPTTTCNLKCSYCYVVQEQRRNTANGEYHYGPRVIGESLRQERVGGVSLISMTAAGETMLSKEIPEIAFEILKQGHFVNITTNGTLTRQVQILLDRTQGYHDHMHISFSLHYVELIRRNLLNAFFENVRKVRNAGCSILVQINLVDEYIPYWDEIKKVCLDNVGALPQVALTRDEIDGTYKLYSKLSMDEYRAKGREMDSPLFECTCDNFMIKRKEFCYAGFWSAKLYLGTGVMTGCYGQGVEQNIFEDPMKPIRFEPIGKHCRCNYCINSSHFISQGIIPKLLPCLSYGELRNREQANWYTKEMKDFLYQQFENTNEELSVGERIRFEIKKEYHNINGSTFPKKIIKKLKCFIYDSQRM